MSGDEGDDGQIIFTGSWLEKYHEEGLTELQLYIVSFYWTCTTITTVGYGDITGNNVGERLFCAIMMILGVISFSFVNGSLASILQNVDSQKAEYQRKLDILNKLYKDYCLPLDIYIETKKTIDYELEILKVEEY